MNKLQELKILEKQMRALKKVPEEMQTPEYKNYYRTIYNQMLIINSMLTEKFEKR